VLRLLKQKKFATTPPLFNYKSMPNTVNLRQWVLRAILQRLKPVLRWVDLRISRVLCNDGMFESVPSVINLRQRDLHAILQRLNAVPSISNLHWRFLQTIL
jgi:hypothetical protein